MKHPLANFRTNSPLTSEEVLATARGIPIPLPKDYTDFMQQTNGGEGFIGENYMIIWKMQDLSEFNRDYETHIYAPEMYLFGSNGGGEAFAFDTRSAEMPIVITPFIGMNLEEAIPAAKTFREFLHIASHESLF